MGCGGNQFPKMAPAALPLLHDVPLLTGRDEVIDVPPLPVASCPDLPFAK